MIAKVIKGSGFGGVLAYSLQEEKGYVIDSNLVNCKTAADYARKLASFKELNERVKKPVFHVAISLEKGTKIDDETFKKIGADFLKGYGFNQPDKGMTPFVMIRHTDTEHPHIHIIASRIDTQGHCHNPGNDYKLVNNICRELEKKYGFNVVQSTKPEIKTKQLEEINMRKRHVREGVKNTDHRGNLVAKIKPLMTGVGGGKRPFKSFVMELKKQGVELRFNTSKDFSRINGISYSYVENGEKVTYKGSALGKGFTWSEVSKKIDFVPERDIQLIKNINQGAELRAQGDTTKVGVPRAQSGMEPGPRMAESGADNRAEQELGKLAEDLIGGGGAGSGVEYREENRTPRRRKRPKL